MKPLRPRYSKIERIVLDLLSKHRVSRAPVPVHDIAEECGANVQLERFNNEISGLLLRNGPDIIIAVERKQAPTRQRFTVAHELGHLLLHEGEELRVDRQFRYNLRSAQSSTAEDVEEIEANFFAAALLMPTSFLERDVGRLTLDIDDEDQIKALAKHYQVSAQAMTIRLLNLHTHGKLF